jgi:CRP/FNR family transcriptional regulator, cyclic AMP receptor protein
MNDVFSSRNRLHALSADELAAIPWLQTVEPELNMRARASLRAAELLSGDAVCHIGQPVRYWLGVVKGLLKMSNTDRNGATVTFAGLPTGGWFGEGTVLKREPYRYSVHALRRSVIAGLPVDMFFELLNGSIGFNRFVMLQLNERLSQFMGSLESDRLNTPEAKMAHCLAQLFNRVLYPGVDDKMRITQQELGYIVGLSRQRVNEALTNLERERLIAVEYGGLRVIDLASLAGYGQHEPIPAAATKDGP